MQSDDPIIRPVRDADFERWLPLWQGYQEFYRARIPDEATRATWNRFFDEKEPVYCLVAERNGKLVGLAHYLFRRSTWLVERDPDEAGGLVLAQVKNNLAELQGSLAWSVSALASQTEDRARTILWRGRSPWSADQLLAKTGKPDSAGTEVERACALLEELLEKGPQSTPVIWEAGRPRVSGGFCERRGEARDPVETNGFMANTRHVALQGSGPPSEKLDHEEVDLSPWPTRHRKVSRPIADDI